MNKSVSELEQWLLSNRRSLPEDEVWEPGFTADRSIVLAKLGNYQRWFVKPERFRKRFFHKIFSLTIEQWELQSDIKLFDDLCAVEAKLSINFQASKQFALANTIYFPEINTHIKTTFQKLVLDAVLGELQKLANGDWIETGLRPVEIKIENTINELLTLNGVQCRTYCMLKADFLALDDNTEVNGRFARQSVFLSLLRKNFEFLERRNQENYSQQEALENQSLLFKQNQLQRLNREDELKRLKVLQESENQQKLLKLQEQLQAEQFKVEKRLQAEKAKHENSLKEIAWQAELEQQKRYHSSQRLMEQQVHQEKIDQQKQFKQTELAIEIANYEKEQADWATAKERVHIEQFNQDQRLKRQAFAEDMMRQQAQEREKKQWDEQAYAEKLRQQARINDMQLKAEIEDRERRFLATEKSEEFLRREIELLILERQRSELSQAVKKHDNMS